MSSIWDAVYPSRCRAGGNRQVDDLEVAAAGELLELHEREVGLTPVVSQSITRPIVPVGAMTVTWALR
jgi:hypothetical protein